MGTLGGPDIERLVVLSEWGSVDTWPVSDHMTFADPIAPLTRAAEPAMQRSQSSGGRWKCQSSRRFKQHTPSSFRTHTARVHREPLFDTAAHWRPVTLLHSLESLSARLSSARIYRPTLLPSRCLGPLEPSRPPSAAFSADRLELGSRAGGLRASPQRPPRPASPFALLRPCPTLTLRPSSARPTRSMCASSVADRQV